MALSEVILQNLMPKNFLDSSDEEVDLWSLSGGGSGSSSQSGDSLGSPLQYHGKEQDFRRFGDYFGLSNLLNNVKISDDNPLAFSSAKGLSMFNKARRSSWESDVSDHGVVTSPRLENPYHYDDQFVEAGDIRDRHLNFSEPPFKQLPPPSMRLSKAMRDHIISGAYQTRFSNRPAEKFTAETGMPPLNPIAAHLSTPNINMSHQIVGGSNPRPQSGIQVCVFCRNNKESESVYTSHILKDADGRTLCPILRAYTCPICKAHGDNSHTIKYCPENQSNRVLALGSGNQFGGNSVFNRNLRNQGTRPLQNNLHGMPPHPPTSGASMGNVNNQNLSHNNGKLRP